MATLEGDDTGPDHWPRHSSRGTHADPLGGLVPSVIYTVRTPSGQAAHDAAQGVEPDPEPVGVSWQATQAIVAGARLRPQPDFPPVPRVTVETLREQTIVKRRGRYT